MTTTNNKMPEVNVQAVPTLKGLRHYLDYQYPPTRGDIQLNRFCNMLADCVPADLLEQRAKLAAEMWVESEYPRPNHTRCFTEAKVKELTAIITEAMKGEMK